MELISWIFHSIFGEYRFQAAFVKWPVVGHKWQTLDTWGNLCPDFRKWGLSVGIASGQSMHLGGPVCIVIWCGLNETVEFIDNFTSSHYNYADTAHA